MRRLQFRRYGFPRRFWHCGSEAPSQRRRRYCCGGRCGLWAGVLAAVAGLLAADGRAETFELALRRVESPPGARSAYRPIDRVARAVYPQHFYRQVGTVANPFRRSGEAEFRTVVKKEPARYASTSPFRAVAKLGSQRFALVLDAVPDVNTAQPSPRGAPASVPAVPAYNRLYFDRNHNGDLTDDPVVKAIGSRTRVYSSASYRYAYFLFPRVDIVVEADGTRIRYAFVLSGYARSQRSYQYASVSLTSAVYREGEIVVGGKKRHVIVVDYNSNGRFDDKAKMVSLRTTSGSMAYAVPGDMIYIDPKLERGRRYGYDVTANDAQQFVGDLVNIGGRYYKIRVTAAGDKITVSDCGVPIGYVKNRNKGFRALVYSGQRVLKVTWDESGKSPLPAGRWKLASYTIDRTPTPAEAKAGGHEAPLLETLARTLAGNRSARAPRRTLLSARAPADYPAVTVREGQTAELPFGPPYKPVVKASSRGGGTVYLTMSLVGTAGESCSNLLVDGSRPGKPAFTITTPDGKIAYTGHFEYG